MLSLCFHYAVLGTRLIKVSFSFLAMSPIYILFSKYEDFFVYLSSRTVSRYLVSFAVRVRVRSCFTSLFISDITTK
jgi:hypothetical protein